MANVVRYLRRNEMKKMTTTLALIAMTFTLATVALGQTAKRKAQGTPTGTVQFGKGPQTKVQGSSQKGFDRGYLSPYASNSYTGATTVNQGTLNNLPLNGGSGNDRLRSTNVQRHPEAVQGNFIGTNLIGASG